MTGTVIDAAWAARVAKQPWARRATERLLGRRQDGAPARLRDDHARRIREAVDSVDLGAGMLRAMLGETEGRPQAPTLVRIDRGAVTIDPREAERLVAAMAPLKQAIVEDAVGAFREALAARKLEGLPENSAANATVQDLISACLTAARTIVERRVADAAAGRFRRKR